MQNCSAFIPHTNDCGPKKTHKKKNTAANGRRIPTSAIFLPFLLSKAEEIEYFNNECHTTLH